MPSLFLDFSCEPFAAVREEFAEHRVAIAFCIVAGAGIYDPAFAKFIAPCELNAVAAVLCAVTRVDIEPQLTKIVLVHQQLTDGGNQRLRQGLTAADIHLHGAILRVQRAAKHLRIVEGEADLTGRHKALKKIKKWDLITHSS